MATSAEQDEHDKHEADEIPAEEKAVGKGEVEKEAEDHAEDHEDEAPAKPSASARAASAKRPGPAGKARQARRAAAGRQQGGSLGKSMLLFAVIIGGLAGGFMLLGRDEQQGTPKPKWTAGQTVDVEITLVKNDRTELACAAADEIGGKHCAFETTSKPWSKGDLNDDKKLLKPYTTTDRMQFTAAGVWSDPALAADKIPSSRFNLKCKYKVDGLLKSMSVRWEATGQWFPNNEWYAGSVSDCKVVP